MTEIIARAARRSIIPPMLISGHAAILLHPPNHFEQSHVARFARLSHFGSITVLLPPTAIDGRTTFCNPSTDGRKTGANGNTNGQRSVLAVRGISASKQTFDGGRWSCRCRWPERIRVSSGQAVGTR